MQILLSKERKPIARLTIKQNSHFLGIESSLLHCDGARLAVGRTVQLAVCTIGIEGDHCIRRLFGNPAEEAVEEEWEESVTVTP